MIAQKNHARIMEAIIDNHVLLGESLIHLLKSAGGWQAWMMIQDAVAKHAYSKLAIVVNTPVKR